MTIPASNKGFSLVRLIGRITPGSRGPLFGPSIVPRRAAADIPRDVHDAIAIRLDSVLRGLDRDRRAHTARIDRMLQQSVGGAALAGLVLGWIAWGSLLIGLAVMVIAALFALLVLFAKAEKGPRAATRTGILAAVAEQLSDLTVDPAPDIPREWFAQLKLMQRVRKVIVDLRLTGQREGRIVGVSRIGLMFGEDRNYKEEHDKGLTFVMVQIDLPGTAGQQDVTVILPKDMGWNIKDAPKVFHGLTERPTGDEGFDARYTSYGDANRLTPALRRSFAELERPARSAQHAMAEVEPGTGMRPWVSILPGQLVVLTPIPKFDGAFEPPPYWQPLDPEDLIPAFAADLAVLETYLNAALHLAKGVTP